MFSIEFDRRRSLYLVTFGGMLTDDEARQYVEDIKAAHGRDVGSRKNYVMLIDVTAAAIQPQSIMEILMRHIAAFPRASALGIAAGASLMKMQIRRALPRDYLQFFDTREQAKTWLTAQPLAAGMPATRPPDA